MLKTIIPYISEFYGQAIIMPSLVPPVTTVIVTIAYRQHTVNAVPARHDSTPLMTYYLTDSFDPAELERSFNEGIFTAAKLYPVNAMTDSSHGAISTGAIMLMLERMEKLGVPLLIYGEVAHTEIDTFDREARSVDTVMGSLYQRLSDLKVVSGHIATKDAAGYICDGSELLAAAITPQHLMFSHSHMLVGDIRPHLYCPPVLKRNIHQQALREPVTGGFNRAFLGTDSTPHACHREEADYSCASRFDAPTVLNSYTIVFEKMNTLQHFETFYSLNGSHFYGLPVSESHVELAREETTVVDNITLPSDSLIPFLAGETVRWTMER